MPENANRTLALEARTEHYLKVIPAAVRKAILECVKDLADDVGPGYVAPTDRDAHDDLMTEAFDAAIDEFTDHLKKTLLLDPEPWLWQSGDRSAVVDSSTMLLYVEFKPRAFYSQDRKDYS